MVPVPPGRAPAPASAALRAAARALREGGLVAFPTETVYGLGANAWDERAVARVFELKGRPRFDPLIVHLADGGDLGGLVREVPEAARRLARAAWPGPLTLVLPKRPEVPGLVTAGLPTVAVRVPAHPLARRLIREAGVPVAAPSANRFGRTSPTTAEHVRRAFPRGLDGLLDGGPCAVGVESTVLAFDPDGGVRLLRAGGWPLEEAEAVVGPVRLSPVPAGAPAAPGMLEQHYATRTPLRLDDGREEVPPGESWGWLGIGRPADPGRYAAVESLAEGDDLRTAAARLFAALHRLDGAGLQGIHARLVPERGLGRAINDRLRRARKGGFSGRPDPVRGP